MIKFHVGLGLHWSNSDLNWSGLSLHLSGPSLHWSDLSLHWFQRYKLLPRQRKLRLKGQTNTADYTDKLNISHFKKKAVATIK